MQLMCRTAVGLAQPSTSYLAPCGKEMGGWPRVITSESSPHTSRPASRPQTHKVPWCLRLEHCEQRRRSFHPLIPTALSDDRFGWFCDGPLTGRAPLKLAIRPETGIVQMARGSVNLREQTFATARESKGPPRNSEYAGGESATQTRSAQTVNEMMMIFVTPNHRAIAHVMLEPARRCSDRVSKCC